MAQSTVKYNCGCGFVCSKLEEAVAHVETMGHTMSCLGRIVPDNKEKRR
jgi:hypothetical protein